MSKLLSNTLLLFNKNLEAVARVREGSNMKLFLIVALASLASAQRGVVRDPIQ